MAQAIPEWAWKCGQEMKRRNDDLHKENKRLFNGFFVVSCVLLVFACPYCNEVSQREADAHTIKVLRQQVVDYRAACTPVTLAIAEEDLCTGYPGCHPPVPSQPSQPTLSLIGQALASITSSSLEFLQSAAGEAAAQAADTAAAAHTHLQRLSAKLSSDIAEALNSITTPARQVLKAAAHKAAVLMADTAAAAHPHQQRLAAALRWLVPAQQQGPSVDDLLPFDGLALSSFRPQPTHHLFLDVLSPEPRPKPPPPANTTCTWDERPWVPAPPPPLPPAPACQAPSLPTLLRCVASPPTYRTAPYASLPASSRGASTCPQHGAAPKPTRTARAEPVKRKVSNLTVAQLVRSVKDAWQDSRDAILEWAAQASFIVGFV